MTCILVPSSSGVTPSCAGLFYIRIVDRSNAGPLCDSHPHRSQPTSSKTNYGGHSPPDVVIEHGALIGIGSIVLDDARVGAHSLVAAGSLISPGTVIPPRSLVMGVPARVKRPLTEEEVLGLNDFWRNYVNYVPFYKSEPQ